MQSNWWFECSHSEHRTEKGIRLESGTASPAVSSLQYDFASASVTFSLKREDRQNQEQVRRPAN